MATPDLVGQPTPGGAMIEEAAEDGPRPKSRGSFDRHPAPAPQQVLHNGQGRSLERVCLVILTVLAVFYTFYFARAILLPITLAVVMSFVLQPCGRWLGRWGIPSVASAALIFLLLSATLTAGILLLAGPTNDWLTKAPRSFQELRTELREVSAPLVKLQKAKKEVDDMTSLPGEEKPVKVRVEQPPLASQMVNTTGSFLTGSIIALVLLFFLLAAGDRFVEKGVELLPTRREKQHIKLLIREVQQKISSYLAIITLINIGLGAVIAAGLWAIGLPNPLLWGLAAALLNYIPFAGLIVGTGLVFLVALTELPTIGQALLAPAIYLAANGIEANFVTPTLLGQSVSLNPVVILLAIFLGGWIWGIGGVFLAVPVLIVIKIACDNYDSLEPLGVFLAR